MIKRAGMALAFGVLVGCAHADRVAIVAATASLVCDWAQTRTVAAVGWPDGRGDINPIMGAHPSEWVVDGYFASAIAVNLAAWALIPRSWRSVYSAGVIGVEAYAIAVNVSGTRTICGVGPTVRGASDREIRRVLRAILEMVDA